jgi:hypothetical protein
MIGANGWIKVDPPYIVFKKLVNNNAKKSPKRFTLPNKKIGKNLVGSIPGFSNRVHLYTNVD